MTVTLYLAHKYVPALLPRIAHHFLLGVSSLTGHMSHTPDSDTFRGRRKFTGMCQQNEADGGLSLLLAFAPTGLMTNCLSATSQKRLQQRQGTVICFMGVWGRILPF